MGSRVAGQGRCSGGTEVMLRRLKFKEQEGVKVSQTKGRGGCREQEEKEEKK